MIVSAVRAALSLSWCLIGYYLRRTYRLSGELKSCHITGAHTRLQVCSEHARFCENCRGKKAAKLHQEVVPHACGLMHYQKVVHSTFNVIT